MKEDVLFKKTPFGGFDREQVIDYVQQLKQTQQNHKVMLSEKEESNKKIVAENMELKKENKQYHDELVLLRKKCSDLENENKNLCVKRDVLQKKIENFDGDSQLASETIKSCNELVDAATEVAKKAENSAKDKILQAIKTIDGCKNMNKAQVTQVLAKLIQELN